jgi:DNA helicase-4
MIKLSKWQSFLGKRYVNLYHEGLMINRNKFPYPSIKNNVSVQSVGPFIILKWGDDLFLFFRNKILKQAFNKLFEFRIKYWENEYRPEFKSLVERSSEFDTLASIKSRYIKTSYINELMDRFSDINATLDNEPNWLKLGFDIRLVSEDFRLFLSDPIAFQRYYNEQWVVSELKNNKTLFDQLEEHPLTERQRLACVTDEDNILVLAGAGTGKTSTMVAKAKYLVVNSYAAPNEIMMMAYGSDAQKELQERVDEHEDLKGLQVSTFHSAGKSIINYYEKNTVSKLATDDKVYAKFVETQIQELLKNEDSGEDFKQFATKYLYPKPNDLEFKSQGEYLHYVKDNGLRALSGDLVKSFEELSIANFLYSNGIKFEYEKVYPFPSSEPGRGSYQPDFYLSDFDIYLEHFGINKEGNTRKGIDAEKYREEMQWKRNFHIENDTVLWETFSHQAKTPDSLINVLEQKINEHCLQNNIQLEDVYQPVSPNTIYMCLKDLGIVSTFSMLLANFLSLFKASPYGLEAIKVGHLDDYNLNRWKIFERLFHWIYKQYQSVLESNKAIDFSDMINKSTVYTEKTEFHEKTKGSFIIKYLLVDEFQDISPIRASFIKALRSANPGCSLMGVGDDWQAIYRFTGSDVRLTTEFEKNFGASEVLQLDKTFRFNDRIEKVASGFVQKNPTQIPKNLFTHTHSYNPEVSIIKDNKEEAIIRVMNALGKPEVGSRPTLMFLSRFKKTLEVVEGLQAKYPSYEIKAMSAHGSKGKQADYVMILDVIDDKWGFPSKIETDSILLSLLPAVDDFKYSEERRLFYVALSRAKQSVFIHTELGRDSVFIKELEENKEHVRVFLNDLSPLFKKDVRCPECLEGNLVPLEGRYGLFYACSLGKNYCKTIVKLCGKCSEAPILPSEHYYECASGSCDNRFKRCPSCHNGMLVERKNSKDDSVFWGCSNFRMNEKNSCRYSVNTEPVTRVSN